MVDQADYRVAKQLAERHFYPFAENIYINLFKAFSHFPLPIRIVSAGLEGETITLMALSVHTCFNSSNKAFDILFDSTSLKLKQLVSGFHPQDITVDVLFGCFLYYYHPSEIRNQLSSYPADQRLTEKQQYEFELKKKTCYIHIV
ncbi:MAG TPA: hypothetical protein EYP36_10475 [Calditrichaeota bacterium]|nr:hypothetical protein [Calditrichota bacterium]